MVTKDTIIEIINETTLEILAIGIIGVALAVVAVQALRGDEITMPLDMAKMVATFYFVKKVVQ